MPQKQNDFNEFQFATYIAGGKMEKEMSIAWGQLKNILEWSTLK